jgi:hypothetical protein
VDQHLKIDQSELDKYAPLNFLGHSMTPAAKNPHYSTSLKESASASGVPLSNSLTDHLEWLVQSLQITQTQIAESQDKLLQQIGVKECQPPAFIKQGNRTLSRFFAKTVLHLEMM